jgi:hypothetical protein
MRRGEAGKGAGDARTASEVDAVRAPEDYGYDTAQ